MKLAIVRSVAVLAAATLVGLGFSGAGLATSPSAL
jgi:hypothetical protein